VLVPPDVADTQSDQPYLQHAPILANASRPRNG
jgi:hypothetical protein